MSHRILWLLTMLAVLLIGGGAWWLLRGVHPGDVRPAIPKPLPGMEGIELRLSKMRLHGVSGGAVIWEVEADSFDVLKNSPIQRFTGLRKAVALNGKKEEVTISANLLERNIANGDINIAGNVQLVAAGLRLRTQAVSWLSKREVLVIPQRCDAHLGDYTLTIDDGANYDVKLGVLSCPGAVTLATRGNTLRAAGLQIDTTTQGLTLQGPVSMSLNVADAQAWSSGTALPAIPAIPEGVKARYAKYLQAHPAAPVPPGMMSPRPVSKGAHP